MKGGKQMKTIKELEAEKKKFKCNHNGYVYYKVGVNVINAKLKALKDVLGLIDELMSQYGCFGLEELKKRINE